MLPTVLKPKPVLGAEKIRISYGPLEFPLSADSLETFAESGKVTGDLKFYAQFLRSPTLAKLRQFLKQRFQVSPVVVSELTYSPMGERVLQGLGQMIRTEARQNGFYALRSALILAARDPQGMSVTDIIRYFPTSSIRINAAQLLELKRQFTTLIDYRDAALVAVAKEMQAESTADPPINFSQFSDLSQPGSFQVSQRVLVLDRDRQTLLGERIKRQFAVDLYLPEGQSKPVPVVVISHGLGSSPSAFAYLGTYLASHGFAVVVPQHIGSDAERQQALLTGILGNSVKPVEFIDRPLDIKYTLDELERLSQSAPTLKGRLNLQEVGVIGHSFGGYTVLALAGADPNFARLHQSCQVPRPTLNAAPILQCLANRLPAFNYHLRDSRVKAVIAISPLTSIVFGPESLSKIQIPTMIVGSSNDFITSVVQEQIHPFLWLQTPEKYLALIIPSGHTLADNTGGEQAPSSNNLSLLLSGRDPSLGREYIKQLSLAFMQTYLGDRPDYKTYLSSTYAQFISHKPLKVDLIRSLTRTQLEQAFGGKPPLPIVPKLVTTPVPSRSEPVLQEIARTGVLRVGIHQDAAPFGYTDANGQQTGFCVELLNSLATQLQQQLNTPVHLAIVAPSSLENRFQIIQNGTVDLECGPNTIRNDIPGVTSSTPFFLTGTNFLVRTEEENRVNPLTELRDIRVGVVKNTTTEGFVQRRYPKARITKFPGTTGGAGGVRALARHDIDAFASDGILLLAEAARQNLPLTSYTLTPNGPLTCDPYGMLLPANDQQWQATVNGFIDSPQFRRLWNKWFTNLSPYTFLNLDYCAD